MDNTVSKAIYYSENIFNKLLIYHYLTWETPKKSFLS